MSMRVFFFFFGFRFVGPFKTEPKFHPEKLDDSTPLQFFLYSDNGPGRCLMSMIKFLIVVQNTFLELYRYLPGSFVKTINVEEITESHVIK